MVFKHLHALYGVSAIYVSFCKNISKFAFILLISFFYHFCSIFTNILFCSSRVPFLRKHSLHRFGYHERAVPSISHATIKLQPMHNATDNVTNSIIFRIFLSTSAAPTTSDGIFLRGVTRARRENLDYQQHADLVMRPYLERFAKQNSDIRQSLLLLLQGNPISSTFYHFLRCVDLPRFTP